MKFGLCPSEASATPTWSIGCADMKYRAYARCEVKCANSQRRFMMRSIALRTEGVLLVPLGTLSSKKARRSVLFSIAVCPSKMRLQAHAFYDYCETFVSHNSATVFRYNIAVECKNQRLAVAYHQCEALYIINTKCCISSSRRIMYACAWWYAPHFVRWWYNKPAAWIKK